MDKNIKGKSFERDTVIIFLFSQFANVLNYSFQIISGRILGIETYGSLNVLQSWINVLSVPGTVLALVSAKYVVMMLSENKIELFVPFQRKQRKVIDILITLFIIVFIFSICVFNIFHISNISLLIIVVISILTLYISVYRGIMQGTQDFVGYGIQNLIFFLGRFVLCIAIAVIGLKENEITIGYGIALLISFFYCKAKVRNGSLLHSDVVMTDVTKIKNMRLLKVFISVIAIQFCISLLLNGDMLLINMLFDSTEKGYYSSVMIIGKIPFYMSGAIVTTLFPKAIKLKKEDKSTRIILVKSIVYGLAIVIGCIWGIMYFDKFILGTIMGTKYLNAIELLPMACILTIPVSLMNILINYALAIDKVGFCVITSTIGITFSIIGVINFHTTIQQVLIILSIVLGIVTIINMIYLLVDSKNTYSKIVSLYEL